MILLKQETNISLKQEIKKINCLSTAYNNTFVLSIVVKPARTEAILHINAQGQILYRRDYDGEIGSFGMLRDKEVIVLNPKKSVIEIINLQNQSLHQINHNYILDDADQMQIFTFYETKYFCVLEQEGTEVDDRFKLTYYNYNSIFQDESPISIAENVIEQDTISIVKANDHSMVAWFRQKQQEEIQIHTWDLKEEHGGKQNYIEIRNTIGDKYQMENIEIVIHNLWESKDGIFTLVCSSNHREQADSVAQVVVNNNFILDRKQETVRQASYLLHDTQGNRFWNNSIADTFCLGTHSVYYTRQENRQANNLPVFYIDHDKETVIAYDRWNYSCYCNFYIPGYDNSQLVVGEYDNGDVKQIKVASKRLAEFKEVALHFMLHVNQDFDDDLLQDALELLDLIQ